MDRTPHGDAADVLLRAAYPSERKRASAAHWFGWVAYQMGDDKLVRGTNFPHGGQDLWRLQSQLGGALALARTIGAGLLLVMSPFLVISGSLVAGFHSYAVFRRWAYGLPQRLEHALLSQPLAYAVAHGLLIQKGGGYTFSDPALRAGLAARYQADLDARAREQASGIAQTSGRRRILGFLDDRGIDRICTVVVAGAVAWVLMMSVVAVSRGGLGPQSEGGQIAVFVVLLAGRVGVRPAAPFVRWTVASFPGLSRAQATTAAALVVAVLAALIIGSGPALAATLATVLPASFAAGCGLWACLLSRRLQARRWARGRLLYLPDAIAAVMIGITATILVCRSLLTTEPATALLFPIAAWGSLRAWHAMSHSERLTVRAAADLILSLLLGADLVLFAVWLSNLLGISRAEVSVLRMALGRAGDLADLPWWAWVTVYLILAGTSVALGRWPGRLRRARDLLRAAPAVSPTRRVLTGVHIGLLVIVFVAVSAPAVVTPLLRHQVSARYDVALQRKLEAAQIRDAYTWISDSFVPPAPGNAVLPNVVATILRIGHLSTGDTALATESDLARRLGRLQATTLLLPPPPKAPEAVGDNGPSLDKDLRNLDEVEQEGDALSEQAEHIGEYAAAAIASSISVLHAGHQEVVQIVREYLSGLIEESPLKDIVATWYQNSRWHVAPLPVDKVVVPDAAQLKQAALAELERTAPQGKDVTKMLSAIRDDPPAVAAVELANTTRYTQEGTGPCDSICKLTTPSKAPAGPDVGQPEPEAPDDPFVDLPH